MSQFFDLPWVPYPKGRPRVTVRGGFARAYTPAKTRTAEAELRYMLAEKGAVCFERATPLSVGVAFRVPRPTSTPKRVLFPVNRPDIENFCKTLLDAGNGLLWIDDSQVVQLFASKIFGSPGIELRVEEVK